MAGLATQETDRSTENFISGIDNKSKQEDAQILLDLISKVSGYPAKVWGNEKVPDYLIGYGKYTYTRKGSKDEYEWFNLGFAVRKTKITVYLTLDLDQETEILSRLGKHKCGRGCLYLNKLADIDLSVLSELLLKSKNAKWHQA